MPPSILSGAAARVRATAPTNSVRRRHVSKSGSEKRHDAPTAAGVGARAGLAFPARNVPGGVNAEWRRGDATRARVIDPHPGRGALTAEGEGDDNDERRDRDDEDDASPERDRDALRGGRPARPRVGDRDHAAGTADDDDADDEDGEDDVLEHLPYIRVLVAHRRGGHPLDSIDEDIQLAAAAEETAALAEETDADRSTASDPASSASSQASTQASSVPSGGTFVVQKSVGVGDEFIGYGALFASIANLGLLALVNSCIEPVISSAETACAGKIGVFTSAMRRFRLSHGHGEARGVATGHVFIAKVAAGESRGLNGGSEEEEAAKQRNTITAAVAASFVSGAVLYAAAVPPPL